jgi:neutral ceramidase
MTLSDEQTFRAGTGVTTITPPLGTPLSGHFEYREARTIADDLTARALVLDDGATRLALVVCDLIRISAATVATARERIAARTGIPSDCVMISATHTHTGPVTYSSEGNAGEPPVRPDGPEPTYHRVSRVAGVLLSAPADPDYLDWVATRIADSVAIACTRLVPARVAWGVTDVEGVCFNRRFHMKNGTVVFNPGINNPELVAVAGPTDPMVTSLLVESVDDVPLALWANLSLHYVGTDDPLAISADYYGQFARLVPRWFGDDCVGLLTNGTSGDINNIDVTGAIMISGTARGQMVATAVAAAAVQSVAVAPRGEPTLVAESIPFSAQRCPITERDLDIASEILAALSDADLPSEAPFSFVVGQAIPQYQWRTYAHEVLVLAEMPEEASSEIQVFRIGDVAIVALPGEIFVGFGLAIKASSPFARMAVVGLANDHLGYVPTLEAVAQGGYETWRTRVSWTAPGTGEAMVNAVLAVLERMAKAEPASGAALVQRGG